MSDQGEVALVLESDDADIRATAYSTIPDSSPEALKFSYVSADPHVSSFLLSRLPPSLDPHASSVSLESTSDFAPPLAQFAATKKKYKPVAQKTRPVLASLPDKFRIVRNIEGDPLSTMPTIPFAAPPFVPTGRYTRERRDALDKTLSHTFLRPAERDLIHHFMCLHNRAFAWDDSERGTFRTDFFPPVEIPVIPHTPWVQRNIPIPPGIYDEVCKVIRRKIDAGVYEPSNSSYRSRWFCVVKKDGKSLRLVHSLEPLNAVTIQHSGVPPIPEHVAEQFAGRACGATFDLYVGYDERLIAEASRDLTTFQTPFGALRLVTLPMGWTNSVPIFHDDVTYILQPEIPHVTIPYVDDVPVKGPLTQYLLPNGEPECIPQNPNIRRFFWEHLANVNRVVTRIEYCGGTFSGTKNNPCSDVYTTIGHVCTPTGRIPDASRVSAIVNWGPCKSLSDVRAFLGTIGVCRIYIKNFAQRAHALVNLTRKDVPFEFGEAQLAAQEDLKAALLASPALRAIDYTSPSPVILSVDTSYIAVGYILAQCAPDNPKVRFYNRFGSITLNEREARFSQPKLELYGLFRALRALRLYLIGVRNLIVEVDARYIKGMLANPDIAPSASINRWIVSILTFQFELVHVPGTHHGPDGLSRRPRQPDDDPEDPDDEFDDWIDNLHGFMHFIQPSITPPTLPSLPRRSSRPRSRVAVLALSLTEDGQDLSGGEGALAYANFPRSKAALEAEKRLELVRTWHSDLQRPPGLKDAEYTTFIRYCTTFFLDGDKLWRKDRHGAHKLVVSIEDRVRILQSCHDDLGHRGTFATRALVVERFWWPSIEVDIIWYVRSCDICQMRQIRQIHIPPTVATPAPVFAKIHIDTMHMPASGGYKYIVQGRCSLTQYPEFRMLRSETAKTLGDWIFQDILCRWGSLVEIVTDNGSAFVKALAYISKHYHINHIRISGYNSRANGLVERPHFDVRQALYKAADGIEKNWSQVAYSVFWSERVTTRRRMGCSPYFAVTGCHPIIPLDISEATYLLPPPNSILSTTDLIANRAIALQKRVEQVSALRTKVFEARILAAARFERTHAATIHDFNFARGDLVLMRNTQIEKSLNRKMRARYLGPLVTLSRNKGGAYILAELDGSVLDRPVAAFRVIPYLARTKIDISLDDIDIDTARLRELEQSTTKGDDDELAELLELDEPELPDDEVPDEDAEDDEGEDLPQE